MEKINIFPSKKRKREDLLDNNTLLNKIYEKLKIIDKKIEKINDIDKIYIKINNLEKQIEKLSVDKDYDIANLQEKLDNLTCNINEYKLELKTNSINDYFS